MTDNDQLLLQTRVSADVHEFITRSAAARGLSIAAWLRIELTHLSAAVPRAGVRAQLQRLENVVSSLRQYETDPKLAKMVPLLLDALEQIVKLQRTFVGLLLR